ncbi:3-hydroxy-5-phosphonooxypentane-2,4-dione thiolase [Trueperella pyogenes]|uniref:3-hydroxy-5-phosphonooxypentane-2,4-dione thiolase n=1 Tax=Trueperella pyogenes TaxID=1661 RepID=UPI0032531D34
MADLEGNINAKNFKVDIAAPDATFHVKGASHLDYGMQKRLSSIFQSDGKTVMLAFDHGYFQGPTRGLERLDLNIAPLARYADALMGTRGSFRTSIPPTEKAPLVLRASGGPSILKELSDERLAVSIEDAIRINASAMAVQVFIGGANETQSVRNMTKLVDAGLNYGIPVLGVTAVGKDLVRDARYLGLATRIIAELGAQLVKTYYTSENFSDVVAGCPVPIIVAGGKKLPVRDALDMAYRSIAEGAAGLDMGRNIFQRQNPTAMIQAVGAVVHQGASVDEAESIYADLSNGATD